MDKLLIDDPALHASALAGLTASPKTLEAKWFYDAAGSALFERITELPEYYPTRTEAAILRAGTDRLAAAVPDDAALVELGSGASVKTRILLDRLDHLAAYVPIDISATFLAQVAEGLRAAYPALPILPVTGDFMSPVTLPPRIADRPKVAFFPGSTIGNLEPADATALLARIRDWPGIARFILGVDLVKDPATLTAAYDDAAGVTAAFNLNLLHRLNREAGADFDPDGFAHEARWNADAARIEMHLVSRHAQTVRLGDTEIAFAAGESIHTENSHKYTRDSLAGLAGVAGWRIADWMTDPDDLFAVSILEPAP
ncbi:L-histidine N(alpha)-methyltransferase [Roseobacter sp. HKCCA0434]|uniref:L-histidine N(alpha)-methyltransferase n=1 Tax=Roseobacter sp. HKCCA0434 TaxID=3079297 RepID=UPI0029058690|nr:L-histidine N(alpha)-methyltransferase [Roseobacter sp. HKCCA0434]